MTNMQPGDMELMMLMVILGSWVVFLLFVIWTAWVCLRAKSSPLSRKIAWIGAFLFWPAFFAAYQVNTKTFGGDMADLIGPLAMLCLPVLLLGGFGTYRSKPGSRRRDITLIVTSVLAAAMVLLSCFVAANRRSELVDTFDHLYAAGATPDTLLPIRLTNAPLDKSTIVKTKIPYDEADTSGLAGLFKAETAIAQENSDTLAHLQNSMNNALHDRGLAIDFNLFINPAVLNQTRTNVGNLRELIKERQAQHARFLTDWQAAIDVSKLSAGTRHLVQEDFNSSAALLRAAYQQIDDAQLGTLDTVGQIMDLAQRGMGSNKIDGRNIIFASKSDQDAYNDASGHIQERNKAEVDAMAALKKLRLQP